jgi:hypothetical protein
MVRSGSSAERSLGAGELLACLIRKERVLLILDGTESLRFSDSDQQDAFEAPA